MPAHRDAGSIAVCVTPVLPDDEVILCRVFS